MLALIGWGWGLTNIIYDRMNPENGTAEFFDGSGAVTDRMDFVNIEKVIPCFTPGVIISTDRGEVAVEPLWAGDVVLTHDSGFRQVAWVGSRSLRLADLIVAPALRPVQIARGAAGCARLWYRMMWWC